MPDDLDVLASMIDVPDGAVPTDAIVLVHYHHPDGEPGLGMGTRGDALMTSRMGLLAWGQSRLYEAMGDDA